MNVNNESKGTKADKFNGRVYHDIATVKETDDDKKLGRKSVWHVCVEETVLFKVSKFFVRKSEMPAYMCEYMESKKVRGHPIRIIRQDNTGENKKLFSLAQGKHRDKTHLRNWHLQCYRRRREQC
jgi:hypothetical protein